MEKNRYGIRNDKLKMYEQEIDVIMSVFCELTKDMDPFDIMSPLLKHAVLSFNDFEDMKNRNPRESREHMAITVLHKMIMTCSIEEFIEILQYNRAYPHLANMIVSKLKHKKNDLHFPGNFQERPSRVNIYTGDRKKVKAYGHHLKRLIHFGKIEEFEKRVHQVETMWNKCRLDVNLDVRKKSYIADLMFTVIDCRIATLRILDEQSMYGHKLFDEMRNIIPYTSCPVLSAMGYIARNGAAVILHDGLDAGLAEIMFAKMHSETIVPCKEAAMVYYQEIDIMVRQYDLDPQVDRKREMITRCSLALEQFDEEDLAVKEDFTRMLYLRMANIYLGLNVFGKIIQGVQCTDEDLSSARDCLKKVKETWDGMDKRRKMFYYIAKAVYNEKKFRPDLALVKSKLALELAEYGKFNKEKHSIQSLIEKYEYENEVSNVRDVADTLHDIENLRICEHLT